MGIIENAPSSIQNNQKSIFIWLDILGFSDAVEKEDQYSILAEQLKKFQRLFNDNGGLGYNTRIISDGIVLHLPKPNYDDFKLILQDIAKKQFQFILENRMFIRGGISVGTMYNPNRDNENNLFISNGLARAVKLESAFINWAVIGTGEKDLNRIKQIFNIYDEDEYFGFKRSLNKRGEIIYFIDFIEHNHEFDHLIKNKIDEFDNLPIVKDKYIWLLKYYLYKYENTTLPKSLQGILL